VLAPWSQKTCTRAFQVHLVEGFVELLAPQGSRTVASEVLGREWGTGSEAELLRSARQVSPRIRSPALTRPQHRRHKLFHRLPETCAKSCCGLDRRNSCGCPHYEDFHAALETPEQMRRKAT